MSAASRAITDLAAGLLVPPEHAIHRLALSSPGRRSTARSYPITDNIYAFADRVEVHSPGGLGGPMRLDNILEKRWSRNATLVQGLVALDIIEDLGFGLDRMVAAMAAAGLPAPVFANHGDTFVVTLYGAAAQLRQSLTSATQERRRPPVREQPAMATSLTPHERQGWALEHLRTVGPLSPQSYADALGLSIDTAKRDLRALVAQGRVRAQGTTRDRRYVLAD